MNDANKVQVRVAVSRDAAFLIEHPTINMATLARNAWNADITAQVARELRSLAASLNAIAAKLEGK